MHFVEGWASDLRSRTVAAPPRASGEGMRRRVSVRDYYNEYWSEGGYRPTGKMVPPLMTLLRKYVPDGAKCLDIGCGDGRTSALWLASHGRTVVGVDVSEQAVADARAAGIEAWTIDDAAALPFEDESFDIAILVEVLEHLFSPHQAVWEARRVLRSRGRLVVTVPNLTYWRQRLDFALVGRWNPLGDHLSVEEPWRDPHIRFFTPRLLRRMLERNGFRILVLGGHGGTLLGDIPFARRLIRRYGGWAGDWQTHPLYVPFQRYAPGLFGYRIHAVAEKHE
jgi:methionine biosynthesis protein MetW